MTPSSTGVTGRALPKHPQDSSTTLQVPPDTIDGRTIPVIPAKAGAFPASLTRSMRFFNWVLIKPSICNR